MVCTTSRILDYSQISNLSTGLFRLKEDSKMERGTKLDGFHSSTDASLFSSSLPVMIHEKLKLDDNEGIEGNGWAVNTKSSLVNELRQGSVVLDQAEVMDGRNLPDEDDLLAGLADDFDFNELPRQVEDLDDDLFSSGGGLELDFDPQENGNTKTPTFPDSFFGNGTTYGISSGIGTLPGEHPFGEHPSRTLFVRNINSNVEDTELRTLFEQYGTIRTLYTACKHRGFVMISYYDIRAARSAMRSLQNKPLRRRKLDIHFSIPKDNPTDKDMNQGTLVVFNLDPSVSNEDLLHIFGAFGEVKEIRETPHKKHHKFIEFYDVRAADAALRHLNRSDIAGKRIKLEPSRPGGARRSMMQQMGNESEHDGVYRPQVGSPMNNSPPGGWTNFGSPTEDGSFQSIHHSVGIGNINSVHRSLPGLAAILPSMVSAPAKVVTEGPRPNSVDALPVTSMGTGAPIHRPHSFSENGSMFNATRYGSPVTGPGPVHGISTPYGSHGVNMIAAIGIPNAAPFSQSKSSSVVGTPSPQQFQWSAQPAYHVQNSAWPRPFNGNARPQQQSYGFSGRHPSYMNHVMAPHHHHVGSAPSGEPLHHGYFTDSPDPSFMHPRSFNGMGFVNGSPMMNINGFGFPNNGVAENGSPNFPIRSPQHMSHVHLAGGPPGSVNNYGDGQTERGRSRRGENLANQLDNKKQYQLDLDKIISGEDTRTTLMIKNIPNKYTSKMLLAAIDEHHRGTYDFLYLPIDFKNKCNVGYAFLNMTSPNHIISFYKAFNGKKWEKFNSEKVASIAYARIQGKAALVTHFQNSSLMNEDKRCRPILFHPEGTEVGDQEPFPLTINHMVRPSESPLNEDHCNDQESQIRTDKVTIYDGKTLKLKKTISKFKDVAYSGVFRSDGQIVAAGGETGMVQVFDAKSRKVLRQLKGHSRPVRMVRYAVEDKLHLMSGGDDGLVKWWDITMQDELQNLEGHKDYVRCGAASPSTANLWATGSYDHTVRLWDLRSGKTVLQLKHGKPIEDLVFFPSGGLLASAGGNVVKVWDILGGGRAVHVMESHQKTVMSLSISRITKQHQDVANTPFRLITASLDGYMKSFDVTNFKVTHSAKYPSPIRSMGISPSCTALAIGTQSGDLFIRQRKQLDMGMLKSESSVLGKIQSQTLELIERGGEASIHSKAPALRSNNYRYFSRGQNEKASKGDLYVSQKRKVQLKEYDNALKRFCHMEALSSVLKERDIERKLAVMDELSLRKRLIDAVSNLGLDDFGLLISFLSKYATNPKYARFLVPVANIVLNRRAQDLGESQEIKHQLELLKIRVSKEVELQQSMQQLQGIIEPLIRASYH